MNIDLVSIGELKGMSFTIPTYQRGYRWTDIEVKDLLDDIDEFIGQDGGKIYCLQPLVVRMGDGNGLLEDIRKADSVAKVKKLLKDDAEWEVIDGQQRLTTVYILLVFLLENGTDFYKIKYETRSDSQAFLKNISDKEAGKNIDFNHIYNARKTIQEWFDGKDESYKHEFTAVLMDKVKFIWYETDEDNPISVFTRLNIGKISLTNAELIKALLFSSSNFDITDEYAVRLRQQEIADSLASVVPTKEQLKEQARKEREVLEGGDPTTGWTSKQAIRKSVRKAVTVIAHSDISIKHSSPSVVKKLCEKRGMK